MALEPVRLTMNGVDTDRARATTDHVLDAVAKLWEAGRLRALASTAEGDLALRAFEAVAAQSRDQISRATGNGERTLTLRFTIDRAGALVMVAMLRRLFALVSDARLMRSIGGEPVPATDIRFAQPYVDLLEDAVREQTAGEEGAAPPRPPV